MKHLIRWLAASSVVLGSCVAGLADWPMLGHDPGRSGATAEEIRPPFARKWYRLFGDEGLMAGVQPIVAGGKVYVGTLAGRLHAIDAGTGKDAWCFQAGGPILHTSCAGAERVFFGCADGKVYAVGAGDGQLIWAYQTGSAVWNAPVFHEDKLAAGGRDGKVHVLNAETGNVHWAALTGGPVLSSVALDIQRGRVLAASEDMCVYAFDPTTGKRLWRSDKLPGVSFRGYHPVVAPDGSVMVTVQPAMSLGAFDPVLYDMVKEIFGDFASWRHTKEENARLREANFKLLAEKGTYQRELDYLRNRLTAEPHLQTFFVLDGATGRQKFVAPIVYGESMNGPCAPPVVTPDGKVIVKYRVLLRSRYGAYSPFLNVGYLDTAGGHITPIMDQSRTYGWHDSLLLVHDEQCQLSVAGRVLINTHQDNVNAMDLGTLKGYGEPWARNIHEPQPGEAVGIWARLLAGQELPAGKEWLARGTAVYGGGSVLDVPVSIAGDSFYYVPTHEINAGSAVIAYRMSPGAKGAQQSKPPADKLTDEQWKKVQSLPWDWDMLAMPRLNHVLKALPAPVPGTRAQPLTAQAAQAVEAIGDAELDRFLWEAPGIDVPKGEPADALAADLAESVAELISQQWRPLVFPAGKHPVEAYRFFCEPTETLYTLARAYPLLGGKLQRRVKQYVAALSAPDGPLAGPLGQRTFPPDEGEVRSRYDTPAELARRAGCDILRDDPARMYPLWLWAATADDWERVRRDWRALCTLVAKPPNKIEEDCRNGYVAGLIAFCRMADHLGETAARDQAAAVARDAIRRRMEYELAHTRGGLIWQVPAGRTVLARWRHLTPEVGRLLGTCAGPTHRRLMEVVIEHHRPAWWLAWNVETMWRNEAPIEMPTMSAEVFAARGFVLGLGPEKLVPFVDQPWCKADLFYIQKLVLAIESCGRKSWHDVRKDESTEPTESTER